VLIVAPIVPQLEQRQSLFDSPPRQVKAARWGRGGFGGSP
jgi:hypothetical protein